MNTKGNERLNSIVPMLKEKFRHFLAVKYFDRQTRGSKGFENVRLSVEVKKSRWQW